MEDSKQIVQCFKSGEWAEGEALWLAGLAENEDYFDDYTLAADELSKKKQNRKLNELLRTTIKHFMELKKSKLLIKAIQLYARYNSEDRRFIQDYGNAFLASYGKTRPYLSNWMSRLAKPSMTIAEWIDILNKIVALSVGNVVKHTSGWGIGKIVEIHDETMEVVVNLEEKPHHVMNILAAIDSLTPLDNENFEALLKYNQGVLQEEAVSDPLKLMHRLLKFHGDPVTSRDIKIDLCPNILSDVQWSKWWTNVRKMMMEDPFIEISSTGQAKYSMREKPMDWEEEVLGKFQKIVADAGVADPLKSDLQGTTLVDTDICITTILDYLKNSSHGSNCQYFAQILDRLCNIYKEKECWKAAECYFLIEMCMEKTDAPFTPSLTLDDIATDNAVLIYSHLTLNALAPQTFDLLLKYQPNWKEIAGTIFRKTTDLGRDVFYRYIEKEGLIEELLPGIFHDAEHEALMTPDAYIWLARYIFTNKFDEFTFDDDRKLPSMVSCFQRLVSMGSTLKSLRKIEATKKINRLLTTSLTKRVIKELDEKSGLALWEVIDGASFVLDNFRKEFHLHLFDKFPNLFKKQDPLYGTLRGKRQKEMELQDLITRKMEENTKAIGEALSFGDISENAELDAAREVQMQLAQKAKSLQNDMERFVEINLREVDTDKVSIGTKVTLEKDGNQFIYIILGPWDANFEKRIISYLSEIAQRILDCPLGSKVKLPDGEYVISKIERLNEEEFTAE